jgi:DNA-binding PadR family transcriptional regulator
MECAGLIASEWNEADNGRKRKYYAITRKGAALLKDKTGEWTAFTSTVNAVLLAPAGVFA